MTLPALIVAEAENSQSVDFLDEDGTRWKTDHLLRYEASVERAFDRTLGQLERRQRMRLGQPVPLPFKMDISSP